MTINRDARVLFSARVQYDAFLRAVNTVASSQATRIAADEVSIAMGGVVLLEGAQTVNGAKTFTSTLSAPSIVEGGTALASKYAAIGHNHAGVYQPVDGDLTAIAALAGTSGLARKTAANTWALDTNVYLTSYTETDPVFLASAAAGIAGADITNWNAAFGWGNHALAGYLTSYTETDPVFSASAAAGIAALDITNWNTAFGWGNHALAGYLTSFTETDPVFLASAAAGIAGADITNWNTAFGWGDHAAGGYAQDSVVVKLAGTETITGAKTFRPAAGNISVAIRKQLVTNQAVIDFRDEGGFQRNIFGLDGTANADFFIGRYNAAGVWQGAILTAPNATGIVNFQSTPTAGGTALALANAVVNLVDAQTVAGVKTFSGAPRVHRTDPEMLELWHTDASANTGRWRFDVAADGKLTLQGFTDAGVAGQLALDIPRSAGNVPAVNLYANGVVNLATQQFNTGDATSGAVVRHRNGGFYDVGINVMPITDLTGADLTLGPQHAGGLIRKWDTVARTINIPASTDTTIPIGARFEYAGWNPGAVSLVGGAGVSISWMTGAGTTIGNRTFANGSQVTIVRTDAARWFIWGVGIS